MQPENDSSLIKFTWIQHLESLRYRLLWSIGFFIITFLMILPFSEEIFYFLLKPLSCFLVNHQVVYTILYGKFITNIRTALWLAFFISIPFFMYQIWIFIMPALYSYERFIFYILLIGGPIFFYTGVVFVFYIIIPIAWKFFANFQTFGDINIILLPEVNAYLSLICQLFFIFGAAFDLPIVVALLAYLKLISYKDLQYARKYALLIIFVLAAIVTPPDPLSQIFLAVPLYILYELSVLIAWGVNARFKRNR